MQAAVAKDLLHLKAWLEVVSEIVGNGKARYLEDPILQEAGDALMAKIGEASNRLSRGGLVAPSGVVWSSAVSNRNFIIHQYDEVDRELTWFTLARDLLKWNLLLSDLFAEAEATVGG